MEVKELCRRIKEAKEFVVDEESLKGLDIVGITSTEEYTKISEELTRSFWSLPKTQYQEKWVSLVLEKIEKREDKKEMYLSLMNEIKRIWTKIGIRREEKFLMFLKRIVEHLSLESDLSFNEFFTRGPSASYDLTVMTVVINSKKELTEEEMLYLVKYLIDRPDTYFREFFSSLISPKMLQQTIPPSVKEMAYGFGSKKECSPMMRMALYSICGE